jgi:hypothetical protein
MDGKAFPAHGGEVVGRQGVKAAVRVGAFGERHPLPDEGFGLEGRESRPFRVSATSLLMRAPIVVQLQGHGPGLTVGEALHGFAHGRPPAIYAAMADAPTALGCPPQSPMFGVGHVPLGT